jgi:hypothetical protein
VIPTCLLTLKAPAPMPTTHHHFFTSKHYKWILQYQQLFQFYPVHGHTNIVRRNDDNSLVKWALYQRSKMGAVDKYDPKWKQLLNGFHWVLMFTPTNPEPGVREACGVVQCSPWNSECPRKQTTRPAMAGGNIGDNRGNNFAGGG